MSLSTIAASEQRCPGDSTRASQCDAVVEKVEQQQQTIAAPAPNPNLIAGTSLLRTCTTSFVVLPLQVHALGSHSHSHSQRPPPIPCETQSSPEPSTPHTSPWAPDSPPTHTRPRPRPSLRPTPPITLHGRSLAHLHTILVSLTHGRPPWPLRCRSTLTKLPLLAPPPSPSLMPRPSFVPSP